MSENKPTIDGEEVLRSAKECGADVIDYSTDDAPAPNPGGTIMFTADELQAFARYWMARGMQSAAEICLEKRPYADDARYRYLYQSQCAEAIRAAAKQLEAKS